MEYYTNHCWCSNSCWDGKMFDGEVIVSIDNQLNSYSLDKYKNKINNPDWINLIEYQESFAEEEYLSHMETMKKFFTKENMLDKLELIEKGVFKEAFMKKYPTLKQEVIDWLNENIKDNKEGKKAWAIGNSAYLISNSKSSFNLFFQRQIDALKFIHKMSIFKEPTIYFDYFSEESSEINIDKMIEIYNENSEEKIIKENLIIKSVDHDSFIKDLNIYNYKLLDWENTEIDPETGEVYEIKEIDLTKEEIKDLIDRKIFKIETQFKEIQL